MKRTGRETGKKAKKKKKNLDKRKKIKKKEFTFLKCVASWTILTGSIKASLTTIPISDPE